ncbi:MAG: hypothetical protein OES84_04670, partial [Kiritimatiellaceae bacterium]|nr:hypothetical protein [Kiritimatiellaceae bacterium]
MDIKGSVVEVQLGILEQVIGRELKVSALYEKFAEHFPEQQALWSGLAKEEQGHANLLREMKGLYGRAI